MPSWEEIEKRLEQYDLTPFQMRVLKATFEIPRGQTRSYKQVAARAGNPNAARAVGTIMKNNPMAPIIPCHRVIKSDGKLGNYSSPGGTKRKREMLVKEKAIKVS